MAINVNRVLPAPGMPRFPVAQEERFGFLPAILADPNQHTPVEGGVPFVAGPVASKQLTLVCGAFEYIANPVDLRQQQLINSGQTICGVGSSRSKIPCARQPPLVFIRVQSNDNA